MFDLEREANDLFEEVQAEIEGGLDSGEDAFGRMALDACRDALKRAYDAGISAGRRTGTDAP